MHNTVRLLLLPVLFGVTVASFILQPIFIPTVAFAQSGADINRSYDGLIWAPDGLSGGQCFIGGTSTVDVPIDFSLGEGGEENGLQRRLALMQVLITDYNLTPEQAAGPIGNFMLESGGPHLPPNINEYGDVAGPPEFSGGYGWAQWTGPRQVTFINFAVEEGYMESDQVSATDAANYAYFKWELANGFQSTINELQQQSTPEDAALSFEATYEKAGVPAPSIRSQNARQVYEEFIENGGVVSTTCVPSGSAAIVGEYAFPLITTKSAIHNRGMFANNTADQGGHPYIAYDILVDPGTPVAAFLSGTVTKISEDKCPGRLISVFNRESNLTISYLHLSFSGHVDLGEEVVVGQPLGVVGSAANGCGIPHLHIDAARGDTRPRCARENCPPQNQALFVDIGPELYETYQVLPD